MIRAPSTVPLIENRPPASEVPPMTTARIASSSMKSPVLLASAAAVFAGIAGLMITSDATAADPNSTGLFLEIDAILAVVIGGTSLAGGRFSLAGTVIGAFIIQTMTMMIFILGIAPEITLVFKAGVVAAVCLIQSPEARALARRAVRRDMPYQAPPPSSRPTDGGSTLGPAPLPDVTDLVDVANSVQRESS